jgi:phospholipase/carboxylesterase
LEKISVTEKNNNAQKKYSTGRSSVEQAKYAMIMIHGRGADARDIMGLSQYLNLDEFTLLAPQATNSTWYPYSFLQPVQQK